ncbi:MAG: hypothetical protein M1839_007986 [Geoglossum umbratile]|nr:MAG: hypothetical protein M1839_007986 [Geoglossum umbratile]
MCSQLPTNTPRAGKASSPAESPQTTSLREAHEEIGLPRNHALTPLCLLPLYLAKTLLGVRPCIALLPTTSGSDTARSAIQSWRREPGEVAAVFDAPLRGFLDAAPGWYEGAWTQWYGEWRMHSFYVPRGAGGDGRKALAGDAAAAVPPHYKVWGMTARILVDAARIAYGEAPAFEHVAGFGDEGLIVRLMGEGELGPREERAGGGVGAGAGAEGGEGVKQEGDGDEGDDESSPAERAKM